MFKSVKKAVFPVAGMGTRILPATKAVPKEMLTVVDKPLIQYAVDEALAAGIEHIIFVTGQGKTALEDHFDRSDRLETLLTARGKNTILDEMRTAELRDGAISYVRQSKALGLGHAVWCARHIVGNEPFAVILPDDYCLAKTPVLKQMMDHYQQHGGNMVAITEVPKEKTNKYGILDVGQDFGHSVSINGLVEKPNPEDAPSNLSIIGRYILQPEIFDHLQFQEMGAGNEIQLTDAMAKLIGHQPFHGIRYEGDRFDCGDRAGYVKAILATALGRPDLQEDIQDFFTKRVEVVTSQNKTVPLTVTIA
ncbi:MAG: UTP--glucose-1-phosphate uridylyltransferase [Alphaproteobacteria bacterium]|jgi:UTP--glucose-1-phosphate uridylyltransferase